MREVVVLSVNSGSSLDSSSSGSSTEDSIIVSLAHVVSVAIATAEVTEETSIATGSSDSPKR